VYDLIFDSKTKQRGYFKYKEIEQLVTKNWCKEKQYSKEIFQLIILELWHRKFID
jgi:hypothetical protein